MILLDLDHFKHLNDAHGHQVGDDCLKAVAAALERSLVRKTDLASRFGGEKFMLVLPGTDLAGATRVAENVRRTIEGLGVDTSTSDTVKLTTSLGVAATIPGPETSLDELVAAADRALYEAKRNGRNRVVVALRHGEASRPS